MAPFDIYYWSAIVNIALSRTISEKKRDSGRKSRFFSYPMHSTPQLGGGVPSEYCHTVWRGRN